MGVTTRATPPDGGGLGRAASAGLERAEPALGLRRVAARAADLLRTEDELLEGVLARGADELADRHASESSSGPFGIHGPSRGLLMPPRSAIRLAVAASGVGLTVGDVLDLDHLPLEIGRAHV